MRKLLQNSLIAVGSAALLAWTAGSTFATICAFGPGGGSYADWGGSYCHNAMLINEHVLEDCPCHTRGSVSATGPFACSFFAQIEWGGPFGSNSITYDAPTAMVATWDLWLDCGEAYKVDLSCACGERPHQTYYMDKGNCGTECPEGPPPTP